MELSSTTQLVFLCSLGVSHNTILRNTSPRPQTPPHAPLHAPAAPEYDPTLHSVHAVAPVAPPSPSAASPQASNSPPVTILRRLGSVWTGGVRAHKDVPDGSPRSPSSLPPAHRQKTPCSTLSTHLQQSRTRRHRECMWRCWWRLRTRRTRQRRAEMR
jgi:hypothetical protein